MYISLRGGSSLAPEVICAAAGVEHDLLLGYAQQVVNRHAHGPPHDPPRAVEIRRAFSVASSEGVKACGLPTGNQRRTNSTMMRRPARAAGCRVVLDCHNVEAELVEELAGASTGTDLESRVRREVLPGHHQAVVAVPARDYKKAGAHRTLPYTVGVL